MNDLVSGIASNLDSIVAGLFIGFAFGSVPFGYLLVRLKTGGDVRHSGSGNIGATNVGRALGVSGGAVTLLLDAAKGAAGAFAADYFGAAVLGAAPAPAAAAGALGAVLGHCYTPWLGGRGGKGVATWLGAFGLIAPAATGICAAVLVATLAASRMMSAASLLGSMALPLVAWWLGEPAYTVAAASLAFLVIVWRHRANIRRIVRGQESRLGRAKA